MTNQTKIRLMQAARLSETYTSLLWRAYYAAYFDNEETCIGTLEALYSTTADGRIRELILDTPEKLRDFLKRTNHEDEPQLWKVRWQSRDDTTVYIWYKDEPHIVTSHVVSVLRELPEPPSLMRRILDFLFN